MAHAHGHHHHDHAHSHHVSRKLTIATAANLLVVVAEIAIGLYAGSLALIGDALHNLTDAGALVIALMAVRLERRTPTPEKSFGYHRAGILAAFINAGMLAAFALFIFSESWERLQHPHEVHTPSMLIMAAIALVINAATAISLHHESRDDVNIRGAFVHMIGDAVASAGIIVAALLIRMTGTVIWDAIVSALIGVLILWSSYGVLRESVNLLLEGTPAGIDPHEVTNALGGIEGILGVHHLHIWALGPSSPALSCHIMVGDVPVKTTSRLVEEINTMLAREYRIAHTTIQFEFAECAEDDPYCVPLRRRS
ncbi:MAG TPA: cation diffusion facilitator family transporter [Thermoanaerobaculia bacterium]|jgi:cobalt-zinc-cadmium efflux system protein|nr:cation diffusion facilitator family transporter [Thermoanaerobaculia bacterium]